MRAGCLPWANPAARAGSLLAEVTAHTRLAQKNNFLSSKAKTLFIRFLLVRAAVNSSSAWWS
jgi:hypothetical protein